MYTVELTVGQDIFRYKVKVMGPDLDAVSNKALALVKEATSSVDAVAAVRDRLRAV